MRKALITTAAVAAATFGAAGVSLAASGSLAAPEAASSPVIHGCENTSTRALSEAPGARHLLPCPKGQVAVSWNQKGPQGPAGPSGVVSTVTSDLGGVASVPTGGGFVANSTQVGTIALKAGTYLLSLNAKATPPSGGTGSAEVFPQFFVYNQVKNSSFTGDLFNVGSGALESGANSQIDSYFSGSTVVTLASDTTLHIYAFGYDSDRGAGTYALDDLSVTATQIKAG